MTAGGPLVPMLRHTFFRFNERSRLDRIEQDCCFSGHLIISSGFNSEYDEIPEKIQYEQAEFE